MPITNKIAVLMSTYNGEKYIKEQIESILAQENVHLDIYIRDDGSTDSTMGIIQEYEESGRVKKIIPADRNLGPGQSFMTLLYHVAALNEYDYYAFADQDDIWLPLKLKVAVEKLQGSDSPSLYGSNRTIYENGENKGLCFKNNLDNSLQRRIIRTEMAGCTMVFNDALIRLIVSHAMPPSEAIDYRNHDAWILLVALVTGKVIYDPNSYILYRIHESNTVGIKKAPTRERLGHLFNHLLKKGSWRTSRRNLYSRTAKLLLEYYYPEMSDENKKILEKYANYRTSLRDKHALMSDKELIASTGEDSIIFRLKVLLNYL